MSTFENFSINAEMIAVLKGCNKQRDCWARCYSAAWSELVLMAQQVQREHAERKAARDRAAELDK